MAPRLSGLNCNIFKISFVPQFPRDLDTKKTPQNIEVYSESLGTMIEYYYIERGLLRDETRG